MKYTLVYLSPWSVGGFTSFTNHLAQCLMGEVQVIRCNTDRDERNERTLKGHGFKYRNVSVAAACAIARSMPTLITAVARPDDLKDPETIPKLLAAGAKVCVQSTQEFKQFAHVKPLMQDGSRVVVIREQLRRYFKGSKYLPHPYFRSLDEDQLPAWGLRDAACSTCMVATNKHPEMLLGANEKLPKKLRVKLFGKCTTHFLDAALKKKYPAYETPPGFRTSAEATLHAMKYRYSIDLSDYDGDGGGTQYSFLEAMDAGAVPVVHSNWERAKGDMRHGENCVSVCDVDELVGLIRGKASTKMPGPLSRIPRAGMLKTLKAHGPKAIKEAMVEVML